MDYLLFSAHYSSSDVINVVMSWGTELWVSIKASLLIYKQLSKNQQNYKYLFQVGVAPEMGRGKSTVCSFPLSDSTVSVLFIDLNGVINPIARVINI